MPAYVNYNVLLASDHEDEEGIQDDFAQTGTHHSREFHGSTYFRFSLVYQMSVAQFNTICAAYDANKRADFTGFEYYEVSPMQTYTVKFLARPRVTANLGDNELYVAVRLRGTAD